MPPNQQNPYDFILAPKQQNSHNFNVGGSWKVRILLISVVIILVIILASVANALLSSGSKAQTAKLTEVIKAQNEIARVSGIGNSKAKTASTRNFAINAQLSVSSSQQQLRGVLKKHGVSEKEVAKILASSKNAKTDAALDEATRNNRFDETFNTILAKQLADYQKLAKSAAGSSKSASEKKLLLASSENAVKLATKPAATTTTEDEVVDDSADSTDDSGADDSTSTDSTEDTTAE